MDYSLITNEKLNYCVYAHINKINGKVYIGITKNVKDRWSRDGSRYAECGYFYNAIKKYGWDNFQHIVLINNISAQMAAEIEVYLIRKYDTINNGYNIMPGGFVPHEPSQNLNKIVYQYDLNGNYIQSWESCASVKRQLGVDASKVVNGLAKSAGGYLWSYEKSERIMPYETRYNIDKPVYQYNIDGTFVRKFDTLSQAIDMYGKSIKKATYENGSKSSYGYRWSKEYFEKLPPLPKVQRKKTKIKITEKKTNFSKVYQYNLDCELIKIYDNYREVFPNDSKKTDKIYNLCLNKNKTVYDYSVWSFDNNVDITKIRECIDKYNQKNRQVDQYDLDGVYINTFPNATYIQKIMGFDHYLIGQACKHIIKTAYGYQWNYHNEEFISANEYKGIALPVLQFDLNGNFIKEYKNAITAALEISNGKITTGSHISAACRNERLTAYGFQWRLKRNYNNDIQPTTHDLKKPKKVIQYDLDGNYVGEFNSIADAARSVNNGKKHGQSHIAQVCKHERNTAYGFVWEFAEGGDAVCR